VAARELLVERFLPVRSRPNACIRIEIEEDLFETEALDGPGDIIGDLPVISSAIFWSRLEWLMKIAGISTPRPIRSVAVPSRCQAGK
jgi:hypothetical protein